MVERGDWGVGDDKRMLLALQEGGYELEWEVPWGSLVEGRTEQVRLCVWRSALTHAQSSCSCVWHSAYACIAQVRLRVWHCAFTYAKQLQLRVAHLRTSCHSQLAMSFCLAAS